MRLSLDHLGQGNKPSYYFCIEICLIIHLYKRVQKEAVLLELVSFTENKQNRTEQQLVEKYLFGFTKSVSKLD